MPSSIDDAEHCVTCTPSSKPGLHQQEDIARLYKGAAGKQQKSEVSLVLGEVLGESEIKKEQRERLRSQRQYHLDVHRAAECQYDDAL